jgi:hypothetical protein
MANTIEPTSRSDEYKEQLRELKQGITETVETFNTRFRGTLDKVTSAIVNEYPGPTSRIVMITGIMREIFNIYLEALQVDIGKHLAFDEEITLAEAESKALKIERCLREQPNDWDRTAIGHQANFQLPDCL